MPSSTEVVKAFEGLYPLFGGFTNIGMLFTRHRHLAPYGDGVGVWRAAYTGPLIGPPRATYPRSTISVPDSGRKYAEVRVGSTWFWARYRDLRTVAGWMLAPLADE